MFSVADILQKAVVIRRAVLLLFLLRFRKQFGYFFFPNRQIVWNFPPFSLATVVEVTQLRPHVPVMQATRCRAFLLLLSCTNDVILSDIVNVFQN